MTNEEKQIIKDCRIMIVGEDEFIIYIKEELCKLGFCKIVDVEINEIIIDRNTGILIDYIGDGTSVKGNIKDIPVIYPFDLIDGACAIVLFPGDDSSWLEKQNVRQWVSVYISGYCAFWNVEGCDWLHDALRKIKEKRTSKAAMKTAAHMCARIAANIAVGRDVKRYPRFYVVESGGGRVEGGDYLEEDILLIRELRRPLIILATSPIFARISYTSCSEINPRSVAMISCVSVSINDPYAISKKWILSFKDGLPQPSAILDGTDIIDLPN